MRSGVEIVIEAVDLAGKMRGVGLVITGEGRVDAQSAYGKAVSGVAGAALKAKAPCVLVAGSIGAGAEAMFGCGVTAIFSIAEGPATEEELMANAETLLERAGEEVTRLFVAGKAETAKESKASGRRGARARKEKPTRAAARRGRPTKKARQR